MKLLNKQEENISSYQKRRNRNELSSGFIFNKSRDKIYKIDPTNFLAHYEKLSSKNRGW